jgi:hypothetical protein
LLNKIAEPFTPASPTEGIAARHGELVLKCIWKRSRSAEADIRKGKLRAVDLFRILEDFLSVVPAREWKRRSTSGFPLGDMPLRTIKVLIQHIFGEILSPFHPESYLTKPLLLVWPGVLGERGSIEALQLQFGDNYKDCEVSFI